MVSISVKELRERMPFVREELKKGTSFLVIFQSKPIAKLSPVDDLEDLEEASDEDVQLAAMEDWDGEDEEGEGDGEGDFLSKEEVNYYMSLK